MILSNLIKLLSGIIFIFGLFLFPAKCNARANKNISRNDTLLVNSDSCALFFITQNEEFLKYKNLYNEEVKFELNYEYIGNDYTSYYLKSSHSFQDKNIETIIVDSLYSVISFKDGYSIDLLNDELNLLKILLYKQGKTPILITPTFIETAKNIYIQNNNYQYVIEDGYYLLNDFGWWCYSGNEKKLRSINFNDFDINSDAMQDLNFAYGALVPAILSERINVVKYLIKNNIDVNRPCTESLITPLSLVAQVKNKKNRLKIATLLINAGANVNGAGKSSYDYSSYPLTCAINSGDVELVEILINNGATILIEGEPEDYIHSFINNLKTDKPIEAKKIEEIIFK